MSERVVEGDPWTRGEFFGLCVLIVVSWLAIIGLGVLVNWALRWAAGW